MISGQEPAVRKSFSRARTRASPSVSLNPAVLGHVLALQLIDAAMRHAATIGKPFCVTVLDVGGNSKAAVRMDGAPQEETVVFRCCG